jgi:hypothetical protein
MAGGNVSVNAQADIVHLTRDTGGNLILDSQRQLPNNWLMRRGYVDGTGAYGATLVQATVLQRVNDVAASTTWWVNFSNFFDGIAAPTRPPTPVPCAARPVWRTCWNSVVVI